MLVIDLQKCFSVSKVIQKCFLINKYPDFQRKSLIISCKKERSFLAKTPYPNAACIAVLPSL